MPNGLDQFLTSSGRQQLEFILDNLRETKKTMLEINQTGLTFEANLKDAKTLTELIKNASQLTELNEKLTSSTKEVTDALEQKTKAEKLASTTSKDFNKEVQNEVKKLKSDSAKTTKELNRLADEYEKGLKRMAKAQKSADLKQDYAEQKQVLGELRSAVKETEKVHKELENEIRSETNEIEKMQSAYYRLNQRHIEAKNKAKDLGAEYGILDKRFLAAAEDANLLEKKLREIDYKLQDSRRNVGNYTRQWNGLNNSVVQLTREMPAFANSFGTGIMAISNNLPIFIDELERAKLKNEELIASGKRSVPVWKQVRAAIFNWQTALVVGITMIAAYGGKVVDWFKSISQEAKKAAIESANVEDAFQRLADRAKDRQEDLTEEEKLLVAKAKSQGKTEEEITKIEKANIRKRIQAKQEYIRTLQDEVSSYESTLAVQMKSTLATDEDVKKTQERINELNNTILEVDREKQKLNNEIRIKEYNLDELLRKRKEDSDKKYLEDYKKNLQKRLELEQKLNLEIALLREDSQKAAIQTNMRAQQSILKNEESSLEQRLQARWQYSVGVIQLAEIDRNKAIELEKDTHRDILDTIDSLNLTRSQKAEFVAKETERHNKKTLAIIAEFARKQSDAVADYADQAQKDVRKAEEEKIDGFIENWTKFYKQLYATSKDNTKKMKDDFNELLDTWSKRMELFQQIGQTLGSFYDAPIMRQQEYINNLDRQTEAQKIAARLQANTLEEAAKAEARIDAEAFTQKVDNERRLAQLQRQKAIFEKGTTIAAIIADTALAAVRALGMKPYTPANIAQAELVAGIGAAKLIQAVAAPIPSFAVGTDYSPEGLARVSEEGQELRVNPDGTMSLTPKKESIVYLQEGTKIIPNEPTMKLLDFVTGASLRDLRLENNKEDFNRFLASVLVKANKDSADKIVDAIRENKPVPARSKGSNSSFYSSDYYITRFKN